ncbi:hypothetical protein V1477_008255 [Vespula maculifrons]|uniref:Uncharacterized protein n=1 Tax=Vespula maculifrons TaxID=7453 RepID=A0ABD2CCH3_VESMC
MDGWMDKWINGWMVGNPGCHEEENFVVTMDNNTDIRKSSGRENFNVRMSVKERRIEHIKEIKKLRGLTITKKKLQQL